MEMVGMDVALPTIEHCMDHVYHSCSHCLPRGIYWPSFWALRLTRQADKVQVTLQNLDIGASRGLRDDAAASYHLHQAIVASHYEDRA